MPPFVANNPPSKSSLYDLFPSLEAGQLLEIARHEFRPADLYKLDSRFRDRTDIDRLEDSKGKSHRPRTILPSISSSPHSTPTFGCSLPLQLLQATPKPPWSYRMGLPVTMSTFTTCISVTNGPRWSSTTSNIILFAGAK
ncbi:hypothetical protein C8R44DRAFT_938234 [Mycena epipterygia]|nr:hypothetical protein C8R44DRAFT_938234 [Mycena epipterygia]